MARLLGLRSAAPLDSDYASGRRFEIGRQSFDAKLSWEVRQVGIISWENNFDISLVLIGRVVTGSFGEM